VRLHLVHRRPVARVVQVNRDHHEIIHGRADGHQDGLDAVEDLPGLDSDLTSNDLAGDGIYRHRAGDEQEVAGTYSLRVRSDWFHCLAVKTTCLDLAIRAPSLLPFRFSAMPVLFARATIVQYSK